MAKAEGVVHVSEDSSPEAMLAAMRDLQTLINGWEKEGLSPDEMLFVVVAMLVQSADEQDDPRAAIEQVKEMLEEEFTTPAEERSFQYEEPN